MWKKAVVWIAITLVSLLTIVLVILALDLYLTGKKLDEKLMEIRSEGDPISLAGLAPDPIPADQDAAVLLHAIRDDLHAFCRDVEGYTRSDNYATGSPTDLQLEAIEAAFATYPNVLPTVQQAAALKGYQWRLDYTQSPQQFLASCGSEFAMHNDATRVLALHATVLRGHDQWDEAGRAAVAILQQARHFEHDHMLVFLLVALWTHSTAIDAANHALRGGPVSEDTRDLLERELARFNPGPAHKKALKGDRAYGLDCFRNQIFPTPIPWFQRNREQLNYLEVMEGYIQGPPGWYYQESRTSGGRGLSCRRFADSVHPSLQATADAVRKSLARNRALRVLIALLSRDDPSAAPPADLTELGLPKDTTTDPFGGGPLIVTSTPRGWMIYSVGANGRDDGGKLDGYSDVGVGPNADPAETE
jgi:hypothetical protein